MSGSYLGRPVEIAIHLLAPKRAGNDWLCRFEIDWPDAPYGTDVFGVDAVQALYLAMQGVAAVLCTRVPDGVTDLAWLAPDAGFGFPLSPSIRDIADGDDRLI